MKKIYYVLFLTAGLGALVSCDNGNADVVLLDSPPVIELANLPITVESTAPIVFTAKLTDGVSEETSLSPLASYSYSLVDTLTDVEALNGSGDVSGRSQDVDFEIATDDVPVGNYKFIFTATDTKGLSSSVSSDLQIIECGDPASTIGIIGTATPDGWDSDTDLTQDDVNPFVWKTTLTLVEGEAKFRSDNAWEGTSNWGATGFPSGTGEQDGANIPVTAGTYEISLNTCTGAYSFTEEP